MTGMQLGCHLHAPLAAGCDGDNDDGGDDGGHDGGYGGRPPRRARLQAQ